MIKKIEIKNFKNIGDQTIELDPYINSFVGANGSGKSSVIFKAPRLVLQNENWPLSKIKHGESSSSISITSSNHTIKRERTKTSTHITIDGVAFDGKKNVQSDIELLGFFNTTKLGKKVDLHFLKSSDIIDFMPKTPESFYLKLSTIFNFNRIIDLKKEYTSVLKQTAKEVQNHKTNIESLSQTVENLDAEILSLRVQLEYVEQIENLNHWICEINKCIDFSKSLKLQNQERSKLKTSNYYENIFNTLDVIVSTNNLILEELKKKEILSITNNVTKQIKVLKGIEVLIKSFEQLNANKASIMIEIEKLPRCPECNRVL